MSVWWYFARAMRVAADAGAADGGNVHVLSAFSRVHFQNRGRVCACAMRAALA